MSASNLTPKCEKLIFGAFDDIHALGVLHRDIRLQKILIGKQNDQVWIIDFEFSVNVEKSAKGDDRLAKEREQVVDLLTNVKINKPYGTGQ